MSAPYGTGDGSQRTHSEMKPGKDIRNYRHSHSAVKGVFVEGCQRCTFIQIEKAKRSAK